MAKQREQFKQTSSLADKGSVDTAMKATILFSRNIDCDKHNQNELEKLPKINVDERGKIMDSEEGVEYVYDAVETGDKNQMKVLVRAYGFIYI